jgi:hypothetical protein
VSGRVADLDSILSDMPTIFDATRWSFDPRAELEQQKTTVEANVPTGELLKLLELMPGKGLCAYAANFVGLQVQDYRTLVNEALAGREQTLRSLGAELEQALHSFLPPRNWQRPPEPVDTPAAPDGAPEVVAQATTDAADPI